MPTESVPIVVKLAISLRPTSNASSKQASLRIGFSLRATVISNPNSLNFSISSLSKTISPVLSAR